jgi:hypothetical protein
MVRIFANYFTNQRCAIYVRDRSEIPSILTMLNDRTTPRGDWVYVQDLKQENILFFNSSKIYQGFDVREDDNYCRKEIHN